MLDGISNKFGEIVRQISGKSAISDKNIQDAVDEIKLALLEADVNVRVVRRFVNRTIEDAHGVKVTKSVTPSQQFIKIIYDRIVQLLGDEKQDLALKGPDTQSVIVLLGLQGSGKTTTAAKLGMRLKKEGRKPLLVAADLVRPAAVRQLQVLGERIAVEVYTEETKNPVKLTQNALKFAKKNQFDTVIVDTTGRMHIDESMMDEIKEVKKTLNPEETILVADAMTGQQAAEIARTFNSEIDITGVILSKFDSDTRGGAALSLKTVTGKPIKFVGVGEDLKDLEIFHPDRIASRILGMGDVVSLVEKAQETIEQDEAEALQKKIAGATFTLEDYLEQFSRVRKMGSLDSLIKMIPGAQGKINDDDIDEQAMKHEEAIIFSMTFSERRNHRIIGPSRRKRIANGSGRPVYEVNRLLKKFDKTRLMMKKAMKNKKYQAQLMSQLEG